MVSVLEALDPQELTQLLLKSEKSSSEQMIEAYQEAHGQLGTGSNGCSLTQVLVYAHMLTIAHVQYIMKRKY